MSLDTLDAAFVRRLAGAPRRPEPATIPEPARPLHPVDPLHPVHPVDRVAAPSRADTATESSCVERLLALAAEQWAALAGHVEAARQRGRRTIAVAGSRSREGRSTLVECLAATLRSRGREVACASPAELGCVADGPDGLRPTHDRRIVLVDAGIWFPPGPIRRPVLQLASLGCDAAILVRRAGTSGGFARQAALEALGIEVLGEVLTFTDPTEAAAPLSGDAA